MSNASAGEDAVAVAPGYCLCKGIQHPALAAFASDEEYCRNNANWSNIQGRWHSSECSFVVDEKGDKKKSRCSKCNNAYTNIVENVLLNYIKRILLRQRQPQPFLPRRQRRQQQVYRQQTLQPRQTTRHNPRPRRQLMI